ncbi:MAG TPA: D-alanyl-D-alanine carboxypeptidase/D-alanyl-D-alanine-endopeptidase [Aeromicrobium sp.]|nr:D-alanyl-D-alanine carboxypeptidase/D-alanyl-D-alanine-endopeptidase [Aeromicrobium sp.]
MPWVLPTLVLVTLAAVALLYVRGDLNSVLCDGPCPAEFVTAPEGIVELTVAADRPIAESAEPIDAKAVQAAVADSLDSAALGPRVGFVALDARDGKKLAQSGSGALTPASTTKVLTAFAALAELGPETQFATTAVLQGNQVVLVGGGDPYLTAKQVKATTVKKASLARLAKLAAAKLGDSPVTLGYDVSFFTGPAVSSGWESTYVSSQIVAPVSPLWIDRGRVGLGRSSDPAAAAAAAFAVELRAAGVKVTGAPVPAEAAESAEVIARVKSAPVTRILDRMLVDSDNEVAEVMLRQAAIGAGKPGSFESGTETVKLALKSAGVSTSGLELHDGSGLSRKNRIDPRTLAEALVSAQNAAATSPLISALPVGGFNGTMENRFGQATSARGLVHAKTGTLTGVHALTGIATLPGGRPIAFAILADKTEGLNPLQTQAAIDRVAADLVGCACRVTN